MGRVRWGGALGLAALVAAGCGPREDGAGRAQRAMRGPEAVAAAPALARGGAVRSEAAEAGAVQVELLEGRHARVVPLGGGPARTVPRASLPAGVREGDVVVDGRRDAGRTAELWREVAALRRRLAGRAGEIDLWRADAR